MTQYQSFPDAAGGSRTLDKLKALRLPDLAGAAFLDVGCNEGFFCGFASFMGARRVVGIDQTEGFIRRAQKRFPGCEFLAQGWDDLPEGEFDVILLASALHYADDQPALIESLVSRLSDDGVLVLELGIASSRKGGWVTVKREIDERLFPTMAALRETLAPYAWKWMGPSINQDGDPVGRHVVHVSRRRPMAFLLVEPPGFGKSSVAGGLFPKAGIPVVSGDQQIARAASGEISAAPRLAALIEKTYSPYMLDRLLEAVLSAGLAAELVELWLQGSGKGDIAIDAFVPADHQAAVEQEFSNRGYFPVRLRWEKLGRSLLPSEDLERCAEAFYLSLGEGRDAEGPEHEPAGFVDEAKIEGGRLELRGWAVGRTGELPGELRIFLDGKRLAVQRLERQLRNDVQLHLGLAHALVGYRLVALAPASPDADRLAGRLVVRGVDKDGNETPYPFSGRAAAPSH